MLEFLALLREVYPDAGSVERADPLTLIVSFATSLLVPLLIQGVLIPALFPEDDVEGPRVDELQGFTADEGAAMNRCFGPTNRVFGHAMWASPLKEVVRREKVGGGLFGIGSGKVTTYYYFIDIAVAWCEGETSAGGEAISAVKKIWAGDREIFGADTNLSVSSVTDVSANAYSNAAGSFLEFNAPMGGTDLSKFRTGADLTSTGFTNGGNNGAFPVVSAATIPSVGTQVTVQTTTGVDETAGASVSLTETLPSIAAGFANSITHHTGAIGQAKDSVITTAETTNPVPGYSGIAYSVIKNLALRQFGNRVPPMSALIEAHASPYAMRDCVGKICQLAGFESGEYDVSAIPSSTNLRGFLIRGAQVAERALQQLALGFAFTAQERDGVVHFYLRKDATQISIDPNDLTARVPGEGGDGSDRLVRITDDEPETAPRMVSVTYRDPQTDYQRAAMPEVAIDIRSESNHVQKVQVPFVMEAVEARTVAFQFLWTAMSNRRKARFQLPKKHPYLNLAEGDVAVFAAYGQTWKIFVKRSEIGNNDIIVVEGMVETTATYDFPNVPVDSNAGPQSGQPIYVPPFLINHYLQIPPMSDGLVEFPGFVFGTAPFDPNAEFLGASLLEEQPDGTYQTVYINVGEAAIMGFADTALADAGTHSVDRVNTVDVTFHSGTPSSVAESLAREGGNPYLIGNEILWIANWTLVSGTQYRASVLYRGRRNTEDHTSGHVIGDRVIALDEALFNLAIGDPVGSALNYKMVPSGASDSDVNAQSITLQNEHFRPLPPEDIQGSRDGSNNLTITWRHRTRKTTGIVNDPNGDPDLVESSELYEVEVPSASPVRILSSGAGKSVTYTAAQQTSDGLTPGNAVTVRVYQVSASVGRGNHQEKSI